MPETVALKTVGASMDIPGTCTMSTIYNFPGPGNDYGYHGGDPSVGRTLDEYLAPRGHSWVKKCVMACTGIRQDHIEKDLAEHGFKQVHEYPANGRTVKVWMKNLEG